MTSPTIRLYLEDNHALETVATVVAVRDNALAFERSCFYPGGGGQPCDAGRVVFDHAGPLDIVSVHADADGVVWHVCAATPPVGCFGRPARLAVNAERRSAHSRYHTVLHVLNTITLRGYGGRITGAQIATGYARIDFKLERLAPELCAELEAKVNAVLAADHRLSASYLSEYELSRRGDLLRTLEAKPPVVDGRVRVVAIAGFDAQACGGTHVHSTAEIGHFSIFRTENKGRINKRLYVRLDAPNSRG
jgi:misacylated tRNA(Ala) deacylase